MYGNPLQTSGLPQLKHRRRQEKGRSGRLTRSERENEHLGRLRKDKETLMIHL